MTATFFAWRAQAAEGKFPAYIYIFFSQFVIKYIIQKNTWNLTQFL